MFEQHLLKLAARLDDSGEPIAAAQLDYLASESLSRYAFDQKEQVDYKELAAKHQAEMIKESILEKVTGLRPATIRYYTTIGSVVETLKPLLTQAEQLPEGSSKRIEILRYLQDKYNGIYDPHNIDPVPAKINFIDMVNKIDRIIEHNFKNIDIGSMSVDDIVKVFVEKLNELPIVAEMKKLKKSLSSV